MKNLTLALLCVLFATLCGCHHHHHHRHEKDTIHLNSSHIPGYKPGPGGYKPGGPGYKPGKPGKPGPGPGPKY